MNKFYDEFVFLNDNMDAFNYEDEWDFIGEHAAPYFELNIGFYQYINLIDIINTDENEIFDIGIINGRWALIYRPRKYREFE